MSLTVRSSLLGSLPQSPPFGTVRCHARALPTLIHALRVAPIAVGGVKC
jgi:hypothetical protein